MGAGRDLADRCPAEQVAEVTAGQLEAAPGVLHLELGLAQLGFGLAPSAGLAASRWVRIRVASRLAWARRAPIRAASSPTWASRTR